MEEEIPQFGTKPQDECRDRLSAYAVIFNDEQRFLVLKVGEKYHFPGGGMEEGETPEETVVREAREEAGCEITDVKILGKANHYRPSTEIGSINNCATMYTARLVSIDPAQATEADHEVAWVTAAEFLEADPNGFKRWVMSEVQKQL